MFSVLSLLQSPFSEADGSLSQEIRRFITTFPVVAGSYSESSESSLHLHAAFLMFPFNIILLSSTTSPKLSFPYIFSNQLLYSFLM
jgi:hypothetical protein